MEATTQRLGPAKRRSTEPVSHSTQPSGRDGAQADLRGSSATRGLLLVSAVIIVAILGGRYYFAKSEAETTATLPAAREPAPAAVPPPAATEPAAAAESVRAPAGEAAPAASAAPLASGDPAPASAAQSAPTATNAAPSPSDAPPLAEGFTRVIVKISPAKARLFRKGKPVGSSPVIIDLAPGEKRAYEVGAPGWATRKLVVDGSKPEIFIGLKPDTP
jgi:hypothetical protein